MIKVLIGLHTNTQCENMIPENEYFQTKNLQKGGLSSKCLNKQRELLH